MNRERGGCWPAAAARVRTGRVHQREVGVDVSLSVRHVYDQQRRTFREAVCEEWAKAAAGTGAQRQARGGHHLNRATSENSEVM